jgi:hypothetical protein
MIPGGFASNGELSEKKVYNQLKLLFQIDRSGRIYARADGNAFLSFRKNLKIKVGGALHIKAKDKITFESEGGIDIRGESSVKISGSDVTIANGSLGVARLGDQVIVMLTPLLAAANGGVPFTYGNIITASTKVKSA